MVCDPKSEHWRLFAAVFPDQAAMSGLRAALEPLRGSAETPALRWLPDEKLHLTLRFLARVPVDDIERLAVACAAAAQASDRFELEVQGAGAFASPRSASVLWLAARNGSDALRALASRINHAVDALGFTPEPRAFAPHLTVARSKRPRSLASTIDRLAALHVRWQVQDVALVRSHLGGDASRYEVLERFQLRC